LRFREKGAGKYLPLVTLYSGKENKMLCTPIGLGQDTVIKCDQPATTKVSMDIGGGGAKIVWNVCENHLNDIYRKLQKFKADDPIGGERAINRFKTLEYYEE
jgi:hypothetical protein